MDEFDRKRLEYFIKIANDCGYVQLGPGDKLIFNLAIRTLDAEDELRQLDYITSESGKEINLNHWKIEQLEKELASYQIAIDKPE